MKMSVTKFKTYFYYCGGETASYAAEAKGTTIHTLNCFKNETAGLFLQKLFDFFENIIKRKGIALPEKNKIQKYTNIFQEDGKIHIIIWLGEFTPSIQIIKVTTYSRDQCMLDLVAEAKLDVNDYFLGGTFCIELDLQAVMFLHSIALYAILLNQILFASEPNQLALLTDDTYLHISLDERSPGEEVSFTTMFHKQENTKYKRDGFYLVRTNGIDAMGIIYVPIDKWIKGNILVESDLTFNESHFSFSNIREDEDE